MNRRYEQGFTAVEVLVTLFIIGFLLAAGYQAYGLVTGDSQEVRMRAEASNIGYEALRRVSGEAAKPCVTSSPSVTIPDSSTLPLPRSISAAISCPYGTSSLISLTTVTVTYGSTNEKVVHAIYSP